MILEAAKDLAAPGDVLVSRPRGVLHVYRGPRTRSGQHVPARQRPLCRTRTRRLTLTYLPAGWNTLADTAGVLRRLCARCSAVLLRDGGTVEQRPATRLEYRGRYADLTLVDLAYAALLAETPTEVDQVAHLALTLHSYLDCTRTVTAGGRDLGSLNDLVIAARHRVHGFPESFYASAERANDLSLAAADARRDRAKAAREEKNATWEASRPQRPTNTATPQGATA